MVNRYPGYTYTVGEYKLSTERPPRLQAKPLLKIGIRPEEVSRLRESLHLEWQKWVVLTAVTKGARL